MQRKQVAGKHNQTKNKIPQARWSTRSVTYWPGSTWNKSPSNIYSALILGPRWNVSLVTLGWCYWQSRSVCVHLILQDKRLPLVGCWCLLFCVGEREQVDSSLLLRLNIERGQTAMLKCHADHAGGIFFQEAPRRPTSASAHAPLTFALVLCIWDWITPGAVQTLETRLRK